MKGKVWWVAEQDFHGNFRVTVILACTQTLFYFSFRSLGKHRRARKRGEHASESESEREARERKITSPTPTPLRWRSINPPRFTFYHARSTDFEDK